MHGRRNQPQSVTGDTVQREMKSWRRQVNILTSVEFVAIAAFQWSLPFLAYYVQELGITDVKRVAAWSGWMAAGPAITMTVFQPLWGAMADRYGRKLMLLRPLLGAGLVMILMSLVSTPAQLLLLQFLLGCITGTPPAALALAAQKAPRDKVGYATGLVQMGVSAGGSVGPAIGGVLADHMGYRPLFVLSGVSLLLAGLGVLFLISEEHSVFWDNPEGSGFLKDARHVLAVPDMLLAIGVGFGLYLGGNTFMSMVPLFVQQLLSDQRRLGSVAGLITGLAGITSALAAAVAGRRADRLGGNKILLACLVGTVVFTAPLAFSSSVPQVLALRALQSACFGGAIAVLTTVQTIIVSPAQQATTMGLSAGAGAAGRALGPLLGAVIAASLGLGSVFLVGAAILVVVTVMAATGLRDCGARP